MTVMSSPATDNMVYLVSGANKGIGLALVNVILSSHPAAFAYAGCRNVEEATALQNLKEIYPERIEIVCYISPDVEGNAALARVIEGRHGHVDTVIANAGICDNMGSILETAITNIEDHFRTNVYGPLILFQATHFLLRKSRNPKFITISSPAGSIDGITVKHKTIGGIGYGSSKAALNWATRKIHFENEWIVAFPLSPGVVMTDMLKTLIDQDKTGAFEGMFNPSVAAHPDTAAASMLSIIDRSTREEHGGEFMNVDGNKAAW